MSTDRRATVVHENCPRLEVSYQTILSDWSGGLGDRLDAPNGLLVFGQRLLVFPVDLQGPVALTITAPRSWKLASSWTPVAGTGGVLGASPFGVHHFLAQDVGHLQDAFLAGGALRTRQASLPDGRSLRVALMGRLPLEDPKLVSMIQRLIKVQKRHLPEEWTWPVGTQSLTVLALGALGDIKQGAGRRGGAVVEVGAETSPVDVSELLAHELFHAVNGHLLVHSPEAEYETLWFKEGVTTWLAMQSVVQAGFADESWFLRRLAAILKGYYENPLSTQLKAQDMASRFWKDGEARRLPYDKGALLGLLLDMSLSQDGQTGVERVMEVLLEGAAKGRAYSQRDLRRVVISMSPDPAGMDRFWTRFVDGAEPLPLRVALNQLDLRLEQGRASVPYFGFEVAVDNQGSYVASVDPHGPAAKAGLRLGERIVRAPPLGMPSESSLQLELYSLRGRRSVVLRSEPGTSVVYRLDALSHRFVDTLGLGLGPGSTR
jgi:predicted metalloprotease with PDZ domain